MRLSVGLGFGGEERRGFSAIAGVQTLLSASFVVVNVINAAVAAVEAELLLHIFLRSSVGPFRLRVVQALHNSTRPNCRPASSAGVSTEFWRVVSEFHQVRRLLAVLLAVATWFFTTH
jgi:hypothetical protein